MSREIKFRDYDMDNKKLRYFDLDGYDRQEHDAWGNIMQFTGLKDKNGVDIYEGDIVKWSTTRYQSCYEGHDPEKKNELITIEWKSPVEWDSCGFMVTESFDLDQKNNCWLCGANEPLEVIGNIHQNPEQL